jgi:hypothetical protein
VVYLIFIYILFICGFGTCPAQPTDLAELIQKIDARSKSYPDPSAYTATAVSKQWEMDSKWRPEKEVVVTKRIVQQKDSLDETILRAVEIVKGNEKDVTEKTKEAARKLKERQRKKEQGQGGGKDKGDGKDKSEGKDKGGGSGGSFSMSNDQLYPFGEKKRDLYNFTPLADTVMNGKTLMCIQAEAKTDNPETYEGRFYIDPRTYDVLMMDERPSKNPKFVKRMHLKMEFEVAPGNFYIFKRFWMLVDASFLVKKIRMEFEEAHSDVTVSG